MIKPEQRVRDYDVIWLDEYLDELVVPKLSQKGDSPDARLNAIIFKYIKEIGGNSDGSNSGSSSVTSRDLGRFLQSTGESTLSPHILTHPVTTPIDSSCEIVSSY